MGSIVWVALSNFCHFVGQIVWVTLLIAWVTMRGSNFAHQIVWVTFRGSHCFGVWPQCEPCTFYYLSKIIISRIMWVTFLRSYLVGHVFVGHILWVTFRRSHCFGRSHCLSRCNFVTLIYTGRSLWVKLPYIGHINYLGQM